MANYTGVRITGLKTVEANLNRELQGIKVRSGQGLIMFAMRVRKEMETFPPYTPVDTGIMRASWTQNLTWQKGMYIMRMGFSANYAPFVHQMEDTNTNWTRPGSGGHWFETALHRNLPLLRGDLLMRYKT